MPLLFVYPNLVKTMKERGMGYEDLADILGINQTTVSQWLLGKKKPGYDSILLLYQKFDIEPNLLFGIEN